MRNLIIIILTVALVAGVPAAQAKSSKEEKVGVGSGVVIGAIVGGPVGAFVGAALGAKLGDTIHQKNERIGQLQDSVESSRSTVARLERDIDSLGGEILRLQDVARPELISLMEAGIAMDILFRTDESVLADATADRLARLAATLALRARLARPRVLW